MTNVRSVEDVLTKLLRNGRLRRTTAVDRILRAGKGLTRLAIKDGLAELARAHRITGVTVEGQVVGMVGWRQMPVEAPDPLLCHWQNTVVGIEDLDSVRRSMLMSPPREALELAQEDQVELIRCLSLLQADANSGENRYVYSAAGILGSSKVLDAFAALSDFLLSQSDVERARRPLFAITAGAAVPESILFIENPSAFASQLRAGFPARNLAVCAFGYGLTIENLGRKLNDGSVIACPAAGERPDLAKIVPTSPCFFWGDLDLEGLRIFETLRRAVPHLQLSAIYQRMASLLANRCTSHPYNALFGIGKAAQRAPKGDTAEVRALAALCASRAVDQEAVCPVRDSDLLVRAYLL
jgi:hypothetical protein